MDVHEALRELNKSSPFKKWKAAHKDFFLAHVIAEKENFQFGFYNPRENSVASFAISKSGVDFQPEQQVVRSEEEILPLEMGEVKIELEKALKKAGEEFSSRYPGEKEVQKLVLLQNSKKGPLWNITFISPRTLKGYNYKVSATSGEVVHHHSKSLLG